MYCPEVTNQCLRHVLLDRKTSAHRGMLSGGCAFGERHHEELPVGPFTHNVSQIIHDPKGTYYQA